MKNSGRGYYAAMRVPIVKGGRQEVLCNGKKRS